MTRSDLAVNFLFTSNLSGCNEEKNEYLILKNCENKNVLSILADLVKKQKQPLGLCAYKLKLQVFQITSMHIHTNNIAKRANK